MISANEIVCAGEEAIDIIKNAIEELNCISEYKSITEALYEDIVEIERVIAENSEEALQERKRELRCMNLEYERIAR